MESWWTSLINESLNYAPLIVGSIAFFESLALIGLLIPGIILMTTIGTLIGDGKLSFYIAWISGTIGCFFGDWISYYLGLYCKNWLYDLHFFKKNDYIIDKTRYLLNNYNMIAILLGRFIGPTRSFIPIVAGILKIPIKKFIVPSVIGCILWPPVYFLPGIITVKALNIPEILKNDYFKWFLIIIIISIWLGIGSILKWWINKKQKK